MVIQKHWLESRKGPNSNCVGCHMQPYVEASKVGWRGDREGHNFGHNVKLSLLRPLPPTKNVLYGAIATTGTPLAKPLV